MSTKADASTKTTKTCLHRYSKTSRLFYIVLECEMVLKLNKSQNVDKMFRLLTVFKCKCLHFARVLFINGSLFFNTPSHSQAESGISVTPDISRSFMNRSRLNPLVSMSATISSVGQYCSSTVPFSTCSRMK